MNTQAWIKMSDFAPTSKALKMFESNNNFTDHNVLFFIVY